MTFQDVRFTHDSISECFAPYTKEGHGFDQFFLFYPVVSCLGFHVVLAHDSFARVVHQEFFSFRQDGIEVTEKEKLKVLSSAKELLDSDQDRDDSERVYQMHWISLLLLYLMG